MREYYYVDCYGVKLGPYNLETLRKKGLSTDTKVWYQGMNDWYNASEYIELENYITPPIPNNNKSSPYSGSESVNYMQKPDSYLAWSIVSAILCCLPFSIPAIVYAAKVDNLWFNKNYEASIRAAKKAKTWTIISVAVSIGIWIIYLLAYLLGIIIGFSILNAFI